MINNITPITIITRTGMHGCSEIVDFMTEFQLLYRGVLPIVLAFLSLIFVIVNALGLDNHSKLVEGSCSPRTGFPLAD